MMSDKTDFQIVCEEFSSLYKLKTNVPMVYNVSKPKFISRNGKRIIGQKTPKFTYENYQNSFKECEDDNWQIRLLDDSLLSFFYEFNGEGKIIQYSLSFIPSFNEGDLIGCVDRADILEVLNMCFTDYIRIDYSEVGYKRAIHEVQHLHKGLVERNKPKSLSGKDVEEGDDVNLRNEFRIPVNNLLFPLDFVRFIIKYIYQNEESLKHISLRNDDRRELIKISEQDFSINNRGPL